MSNQGEVFSQRLHGFHGYHEDQLFGGGGGCEGFGFPSETTTSLLPYWSLPVIDSSNPSCQFMANNQVLLRDHEDGNNFFPCFPPPLPSPIHGPNPVQFGHGSIVSGSASDDLGLGGLYRASSSPFGNLHAEFKRMSAQEIMDAKALAASKSHSEAERRRRERINTHLAKLRSLLPSTTKTDKASLLAEVIQHVKELKRQTSELAEESLLPTESDELTVDATSGEDGRVVVRASLCCEDRSDLIPELAKTLKALKLRTLKAEITTLGGRVKNILVITGEDGSAAEQQQQTISLIQDALKAVMERTVAGEPQPAGSIKRQRTSSLSGLLEQRSG